MPKPIYATEDMIETTFENIRKEFEEQFAKARAGAKTRKMADGNLDFTFTKFDWSWKKGDEPARAKLTITPAAYSKIMLTIMTTDKEVGWHGFIHRDPENETNFVLEDILFFPQEVTGATVVADESAYPTWTWTVPEEKFKQMRFHGHSHVNMATSPSGTDMDYRARLIHQFEDGFYVFLIINKKLETNCQIYDFDNNMLYSTGEIDVVIGDDYATEVAEATRAMVKSKTYTYGGGYGNGYNGYYGGGYQNGSSTGKGAGKSSTPALPSVTGGGKKSSRFQEDDEEWWSEEYWRRIMGGSDR